MFRQTLFAIALMGATTVHAQDPITDDELCDKAVAYSVKYIPEEDGLTLHKARWRILEGDRTDDQQKMVGIVIFEIGQRIGYSYNEEVHGPGPKWIEEQVELMTETCIKAVADMRGNPYGEIESANPAEAW